jgi:Tfp pilus assembly PilM family ATPase
VAESTDKPNLFVAVHPDYMSAIEVREERVHSLGWARLQPDCDLEAFREGEAVVGRLRDAFAEIRASMGTGEAAASLALNGSMVLIKKIPVALGLGEEVIQSQMRWEAEQVLLSPVEEYVLSHQRLPFSTPSGNPQYLQVLLRKRVVQLLRSFAKTAGISIREIDVDCFADIRTVVANVDLDPKGTAVLADVRPGRLGFVLIHHQEFFLNTRIPVPREASPGETAKILLKELRRLVFGHRGKGIDDLERVLLKGDGPLQVMVQELKGQVPTEILNPFDRIVVSPEAKKSDFITRDAGRFIAPIGLALKRIPTLQTHS